jgi:hypothetical protein
VSLSAKACLAPGAPPLDKPVISSAATVAGGRFAPGHLGELAQQVPFGMAGAVLEQTCRVQRRVRALPARVVVYRPGRILGQALRGGGAARAAATRRDRDRLLRAQVHRFRRPPRASRPATENRSFGFQRRVAPARASTWFQARSSQASGTISHQSWF